MPPFMSNLKLKGYPGVSILRHDVDTAAQETSQIGIMMMMTTTTTTMTLTTTVTIILMMMMMMMMMMITTTITKMKITKIIT